MKNEVFTAATKTGAYAMAKRTVFLLVVLLLSSLVLPGVGIASAKKATIDGSFITGGLCSSWTDARWQQELGVMKDAGMQYLIIAAVAESFPGKPSRMIYPSKLPNTEMAKGRKGAAFPDIVDACLRNAQKAGMKVFVGIDASDNWWAVYATDTAWLYGQMDFGNKVCDELWSQYKKKYPEAFYGWYWAYEIDNANYPKPVHLQVLTKAINMQLDHLSAAQERLPVMWCPFMNSNLGTPSAYQAMWQTLFAGLHLIPGDIFCPQDCVGAGGLKLNQVDPWFAALRQAVNTKPGLLMWSDVETFDLSDNTCATIGRVVSQLKIEQPYVDHYVTWEYIEFDSPFNVDPGFHRTYLDYVKTGKLESAPPTVPPGFTAVLQPSGDVVMNWQPATDNIGVCGYYVYRNGELIFKNQVPRTRRMKTPTPSLTTLTDVCLRTNTDYTYEVRAYDFAGNVSAPTPPVRINTGNIVYLPNIVSAGRPYTVSIPTYRDSLGTKTRVLTDGVFADSATVNDPKWEGFHDTHQKPRDVVIDLGRTMPVQQFVADYLLDPKALVYLPVKITVLVSTDTVNFKEVGTFGNPNVTSEAPAASYQYRLILSAPMDARYVDFRTVPLARWFDQLTFSDEFEVRSNTPAGAK